MKNLGYVALHRKLLYSDVWEKTNSKAHDVIIALLLKVQHKEKEFDIEGDKYTIQPGEIIIKYDEIRELCGTDINYNHVRSAICKLIDLGFITKQNVGRKNSPRLLIKIVNWRKYQNADLPSSKKDSLPPKLPGNLPPKQSPASIDNKGSQKEEELSLPPGVTGDLPPEKLITGKITGKVTGEVTAGPSPEIVDNKGLQKEARISLPPEKSPENTGKATSYKRYKGIGEGIEEGIEEKDIIKVGKGKVGSDINYNNNIITGGEITEVNQTNLPHPPSVFNRCEEQEEIWDEEISGPFPGTLTDEQLRIINQSAFDQPNQPLINMETEDEFHKTNCNDLCEAECSITEEDPHPVDQTNPLPDQPTDYSNEEISRVGKEKGITNEALIAEFTEKNRTNERWQFKGGLEDAWDKFINKLYPSEIANQANNTHRPVYQTTTNQPPDLPENYDYHVEEWNEDISGPPNGELTDEQKRLINEPVSANKPTDLPEEYDYPVDEWEEDISGPPDSKLTNEQKRLINEPIPDNPPTHQTTDFSDEEINKVAHEKGIYDSETILKFSELNRDIYHFKVSIRLTHLSRNHPKYYVCFA